MRGPGYLIRFVALGQAVLVCGLLVALAMPSLIDWIIDKQLVLEPNSKSYPMWRELPVPVYQRFYFFNVTNALDVEQRGAKPQLQEIGPFTYRSDWIKRDIEHSDQLISYKHFKSWTFEPDLSIEDERIQLVTLNAPLAITLSLIQSASAAVRLLVTFSLDGLSEGFFTRRSVKQLLFEGYPDLLTTFGPLLNAEMLSQGGHFGYMNARNNSLDASYQVNSGSASLDQLNTIVRYNGRAQLPYWHNPGRRPDGGPCNSLQGASTGDIFPPLRADQRSVRLFQPDFCRVWRLDESPLSSDQNPIEHQSGLLVRRFIASRDVFRNSSDLPENSCFFRSHRHSPSTSHLSHQSTGDSHANRIPNPATSSSEQTQRTSDLSANLPATPISSHLHNSGARHSHQRREWPMGVFSLAPCKFNAPIYISMPHFLDADSFFQSKVQGLHAQPDKHEFYLDLEPRTGSPVQLEARVQLNVAISKPPGLVRFRNIPEIMFPVFWQQLSVNLTGEPVIEQLMLASRLAQQSNQRVAYVLLALSATIQLITALFYLRHWLIPRAQSVLPNHK